MMKNQQKKSAKRLAAIRTAALAVFALALVLNIKITLSGPFSVSSEGVIAQATDPDTGSNYDDTGWEDWCEDFCNADWRGDWEQCEDSNSSSGNGGITGTYANGTVTVTIGGGGSEEHNYNDENKFVCEGGDNEDCTSVPCS